MNLQTEAIDQLVNELPETSSTTYVLKALDYIIPGEWENQTDFRQMIVSVSGQSDEATVDTIQQRALDKFAAADSGYMKATWIFCNVDKADQLLAAASLANKIGRRISFLSFLQKLTPKSDTVQSIDLGMKIAAEGIAYNFLQGRSAVSVAGFSAGLAEYSKANLMRIVALISIDGLIPLGPDFLEITGNAIGKLSVGDLSRNPIYERIKDLIPGNSQSDHLNFVQEMYTNTQGWMREFQHERGINRGNVISSLGKVIDLADETLDYVGAFLDAATNYYTHTGIQTVARTLISDVVNEA